jgi:hypothetical protein
VSSALRERGANKLRGDGYARRAKYGIARRQNERRVCDPNCCDYNIRRTQNGSQRWKRLKQAARAHAVTLVVRNGNRMRGCGVL